MVLDRLSTSLKDTLKKITNAIFVDEGLVNELVKDIQRSLLQSDVNVKLVMDISKKIKERALKEECPRAMSKKEFLVHIVYEELVKFLGGEGSKISVSKKPFKIMLVGLFGNGKTTTAGKIGHFFQKRGLKVALVQTDTWRPAAYEQLKQAAEKSKIDFFGIKGEKGPVRIYKKFEKELDSFDVVIVDTAGRDALNDELIGEIKDVRDAVNADETLLVMSADLGQAAQKQAEAFHEACSVTGVVITKLDGTAKGGGALIACSVTGAPVKFIGVGEKINDFEEFKPEGFVGRMLGMGDLEALLEKAKESFTEEQAEDMGKKLLKGDFNLIDLYEQMQSMKKMGPLSKVFEMIPGMGGMHIPKEMLDMQEGKLESWKHIMNSMTKEELEDPEEMMDSSRAQRIAKGSGMPAEDVRALVKQYKQSKKMIKAMGGDSKKMEKMVKKFQRGGIPGGMKF